MLIDERMIKARAALIVSQPFFGTLALYLTLEEDESIGTMATDGKRLIYAPSFLDSTTAKEHIGVIAHEVMHNAFKHHTRRNGRDFELWNVACDYAINPGLVSGGFALPKGALVDAQYKGMGAEEIYALLHAAQKASGQKSGKGSAADGDSGAGRQSDTQNSASGRVDPLQTAGAKQAQSGGNQALGASCGKVLDAAPDYAKAEIAEIEAEWDRNVRQACAVAAAHNAGSVPGYLQELVKETHKARVDWREQLRRFIDDRARTDYSWARPNRRMISQGFILPSSVPDGLLKLGVVIDTSGSVSVGLLAQFKGELQAVLDEQVAQQIVVIQCDTRVTAVQRFEAGDTIELTATGRGGTRFSPALEWFKQNEPDTAALVYFTDLDCSDYGEEPECPLLWAAYGYESRLEALASRVPFGEVIKVTA